MDVGFKCSKLHISVDPCYGLGQWHGLQVQPAERGHCTKGEVKLKKNEWQNPVCLCFNTWMGRCSFNEYFKWFKTTLQNPWSVSWSRLLNSKWFQKQQQGSPTPRITTYHNISDLRLAPVHTGGSENSAHIWAVLTSRHPRSSGVVILNDHSITDQALHITATLAFWSWVRRIKQFSPSLHSVSISNGFEWIVLYINVGMQWMILQHPLLIFKAVYMQAPDSQSGWRRISLVPL